MEKMKVGEAQTKPCNFFAQYNFFQEIKFCNPYAFNLWNKSYSVNLTYQGHIFYIQKLFQKKQLLPKNSHVT